MPLPTRIQATVLKIGGHDDLVWRLQTEFGGGLWRWKSPGSASSARPISCKKHKAIPAVFLLRVDSRRPGQRQLARHALQPENLGTKATQPPMTTEMGNPRSRGGRITDVGCGKLGFRGSL
ncbi:hypothetical protein WN944_012151 [Citrus x changshan-huyou]|uniref:Uncharacterized protein n=1 Tax=Citrus x changshan-huyou TaxID=2935761 RepID=A0AAP0QUB8_9ROSI